MEKNKPEKKKTIRISSIFCKPEKRVTDRKLAFLQALRPTMKKYLIQSDKSATSHGLLTISALFSQTIHSSHQTLKRNTSQTQKKETKRVEVI